MESAVSTTITTPGDQSLLGCKQSKSRTLCVLQSCLESILLLDLSNQRELEELESNSLWIKCRKTIVRTIATFLEGHKGQLSVIVLGCFSDSNVAPQSTQKMSNPTADRVFFEQNCKLIDQFPFFLSSEQKLPRDTLQGII